MGRPYEGESCENLDFRSPNVLAMEATATKSWHVSDCASKTGIVSCQALRRQKSAFQKGRL